MRNGLSNGIHGSGYPMASVRHPYGKLAACRWILSPRVGCRQIWTNLARSPEKIDHVTTFSRGDITRTSGESKQACTWQECGTAADSTDDRLVDDFTHRTVRNPRVPRYNINQSSTMCKWIMSDHWPKNAVFN